MTYKILSAGRQHCAAKANSGHHQGFTLLELLIAMAIVAILTTIAVPSYTTHLDNQKITQAKTCLRQIELAIERYFTVHMDYPATLAEVPLGECKQDPWGNAYRYLKILGKKGKGGNRKDRSENPLNTDYDLYSMGKDGKTNQSLRPKVSHDDIIRAKSGGYIGLAADY